MLVYPRRNQARITLHLYSSWFLPLAYSSDAFFFHLLFLLAFNISIQNMSEINPKAPKNISAHVSVCMYLSILSATFADKLTIPLIVEFNTLIYE